MAAPTVFAIEFVSLFFACVLFVWFYSMTASSVLLVEPIGDAVMIEHLEGARLQTAGARAVELLAGAPLDDRSVDPRQRQRARQHQPARTSAGDRHGTFGHRGTAITSRSTSLDPRADRVEPRPVRPSRRRQHTHLAT